MQKLSTKFYTTLFDKDEYTCFTDSVKGINIKHARRWGPKEKNEYFSINPIAEGTTRAGKNVTAFRNILVEIDQDEHGNLIPGEEQRKMFTRLGLPYSTLVWSGNKSYHAIISVQEGFKDVLEYRQAVLAVYRVLQKNAIPNDEQVKDVSRLSRCAGSVRVDKQQIQEVAEVRDRISRNSFDAWLEAHEERVEEPKLPAVTNYISGSNRDVDAQVLFDKALEWNVGTHNDYSTTKTTGAHMWLFNMGIQFWKVDISLHQGINIAEQQFGQTYVGTNGGGQVGSSLTQGYEFARDEGATQYKIKPPYQQPVIQTETTPGVTLPEALIKEPKVTPYDEVLTNYKLIGGDCYLVYPDKSMTKMNLQGFNARFPSRAITFANLEKYADFGYYPDYFKNKKLKHNKYNAFLKPTVKLTPGEFPITKILLNHVFKEQYELGLEYYWVLRNRPAQALPCLALTGGEDGGKTTFAKHLDMCFKNTTTITMEQLAKEENNYAANRQIIVVEESSMSGETLSKIKEISNKTKIMVTECGGKIPFKQLYNNGNELEYFGHLVMLTNDITPIQMAGEATRFWVLPIGQPKKIERFMESLEEEVGHFLWYLDNEFVPSRTSSKERLWFHPSEYHTEAKDIAKTESGSFVLKAIKDCLKTWFIENDKAICYFDLTSLKNYIHETLDYDIKKGDIKNCLEKELKWGAANERALRTDSLRMEITGQNNTRKMAYWVINENFKLHNESTEADSMWDNLLKTENVQ